MRDIRVKNLSKAFGDKQVLKGFNAVFPLEHTTCLMAPSGFGKTTLLRIIMGLETADSGEIDGMDNCSISAVFQEDRLCENLSAEANIRLVNKQLKKEKVQEGLEKCGLTESAKQPVREFSGGMKRRVALLRALLAEYDFLILDEPFKGLDEVTKQQMIEYTIGQSKGKTVLLVTHDEMEAQKMDAKILRMDEAFSDD